MSPERAGALVQRVIEIETYRTKLRLSFKYEASIGAPEWEGQSARQPAPA